MTLYICLMVAVVLSDQLLKFYIQQNVPLNVSYEVIPGVLSIGHVRNFGAAWSMWLGQRWLLSYGLGFSLLIGGTLGNLLDRLFSGYVVDMFELDLINFPVFNIADCALTLGVIVILITMLKDDEGII